MRVLVTMEAAWHSVPGGTARAAIDLAAALDRRDDVTVSGVAARHRFTPVGDWAPPVPVVHHRIPRVLLYESWSRWSRPALRGLADADVVHSTTVVAPPASRKPLVVSVHDLAFRRHPDRFPDRARRLYERSWRRVLERADAVLCPSVATSADLRAGGLDVDRLHLVPLGHDPLEVTAEQRAAVRKGFGLAGPYVLATGTLEPRKNLPTLVEAFATLAPGRDLGLVLAGPQGWGTSVDQLLAPLEPALRDRVVVTGAVSKIELAALYSEAAVFCYPSLLEGFGLPVLEAMSYGSPVVTSRGTATEEVAGEAALTIDPESPPEVAAALAHVLDDPSVADELVAAGRARSAEFSWDRVAEATLDVYRSL
jgi:glycosyltransferase involved in cell wall biosynthesis